MRAGDAFLDRRFGLAKGEPLLTLSPTLKRTWDQTFEAATQEGLRILEEDRGRSQFVRRIASGNDVNQFAYSQADKAVLDRIRQEIGGDVAKALRVLRTGRLPSEEGHR
jgi:hypothetical protein